MSVSVSLFIGKIYPCICMCGAANEFFHQQVKAVLTVKIFKKI